MKAKKQHHWTNVTDAQNFVVARAHNMLQEWRVVHVVRSGGVDQQHVHEVRWKKNVIYMLLYHR
jgi:hypothetical protein